MKSKEIIEKILEPADVRINGNRPWDIKVLNDKIYDIVFSKGTLGLGEAYMDGWWECDQLDEMFSRVLRQSDTDFLYKNFSMAFHVVKSVVLNLQNKSGSKKVAEEHYDLGNDLYMSFLDPYNQYSCGYFKDTTDLNKAQEQKLDLSCKKLQLKPGDKVLDIGCGWGGLSKWMAEHYKCEVLGITISKEQVAYAKNWTKGLPVKIELLDYRDVTGTFDKIVSVGMFEHVGYKNYREIMEVVKKHLAKDGLFLLHTIGKNTSSTTVEPWISKYIFPNSMMPSQEQLAKASNGLFVLEDWHNFGQYYDPTLMAWFRNFDASWPKLKNTKKIYNERFYRMFKYYLLSCAGSFRSRNIELWQVVFSPHGVLGGYESVR